MSGIQMMLLGGRVVPQVTLATDAYSRSLNTASFTVGNDGNFYATDGGASSLQYAWLIAGITNSVEVKVDPTSGSYSGGSASTGTWLATTTSRTWQINWPGGMSPVSVTATVTLRDAVTLSTLATATIIITATP